MVSAFWQVIAAYTFAVAGGWISTSLQLAHKQLCALISFAAGTLLGVTIFAILPESFGASSWCGVIEAHVGVGFIYLAARALLVEMLKHGKKLVLTSFSAGVALIALLNIGLRVLG